MKVTKLIREYVEEQVSKVYESKENPYSEQANKDREKIGKLSEELKTQQKATLEKFISENEVYEKSWVNGIIPYKICTQTPSLSSMLTPAIISEKKWNEENIQAKNSKIRDIMVALELGANREELNHMIADLLNSEEDDD